MIPMDELLKEIDVDSNIDGTNLEGEIYRSTKLHAKYLKYRFEVKRYYIKRETELAQLINTRYKYYSGNGTPDQYRKQPFNLTIKNQDHMNKLIESDNDVIPLKEMIQSLNEMIGMIDEMIGMLKYRNTHISTVIEIRKFEGGS